MDFPEQEDNSNASFRSFNFEHSDSPGKDVDSSSIKHEFPSDHKDISAIEIAEDTSNILNESQNFLNNQTFESNIDDESNLVDGFIQLCQNSKINLPDSLRTLLCTKNSHFRISKQMVSGYDQQKLICAFSTFI